MTPGSRERGRAKVGRRARGMAKVTEREREGEAGSSGSENNNR